MTGPVRRGRFNPYGEPDRFVVVDAVDAIVDSADSAGLPAQALTHELALHAGRRGGTVIVESVAGFTESQLGAPVFVSLAPGQRRDEVPLITFVGEVINSRQIRLHWAAAEPAPARVAVNIIIGRTGGNT